MSEIQRVALHSAPRSRKEKEPPARSVRLNVELGASNEDQYPEISYRDLIAAHLRKSRTENGKRAPAGPLSDNEDDVARLAKQFEQKYGSLSTYGRSRKSKRDEFADIGAGYDENDSFIDNTDGYDEMCPPGYDTIHGGFYINCGSLEFKNVMEESRAGSDGDQVTGQRSNKRRISSSSSEESSSESSSDSESGADKNKERVLNGEREPARRKKKKNDDKKNVKKRRTDASSAATSGKQTSDDNGQPEGESADSRTSHTEDSLTSKPAPSSENAVTSDSSREVSDAVKPESKLPPVVSVLLSELSECVARLKRESSSVKPVDMDSHTDPYILRLEQALGACGAELRCRRAAWAAAARALGAPRTRLLHRARALAAQPPRAPPAHRAEVGKLPDSGRYFPAESKESPPKQKEMETESELTPEQRERQIADILDRLRTMIEAKKPEMIDTYKAECERIQCANKMIAAANLAVVGARLPERRLPKRRYPWCGRARALLARLVRLCGGGAGAGGGDEAAARLLAHRVLPMFPPGFVRLPTLLRQASLNKDLKVSEIKKQKVPTPGHVVNDTPLPAPITITSVKPAEKTHEVACGTSDPLKLNGKPPKPQTQNDPSASTQKSTYNSIFSSFTLSPGTEVFLEKNKHERDDRKDTVIVERAPEPVKVTADKSSKVDDKYIPPNSIGSITITPVTTQAQKFDPRHQASKLANNTVTITAGVTTKSSEQEPKSKEPSIRVKSPAELMKAASVIAKDDKPQKSKPEIKRPNTLNIKPPENRSHSPLRIDTSYPKKPEPLAKTHSPGNVRPANGDGKTNSSSSENKLPRPGLVPIHHSPTFARPAEKRPETKTKPRDSQVLIVTDVDPLSDVLQVDDSSSDVELVEDVSSKPPDPLSVPEPPKTDAEPAKDSRPKVAQNPESSKLLKHASRELDPSAKGGRTDDRNMRGEPDGSSVEDSSALGRIKEDYTHKHRNHKDDQSGSRSDHRSDRGQQRDSNYVSAERTHKKADQGHSDRSHARDGHRQHPDRMRDESHTSKTHREKEKRDLGPSEKRHRSDDRHSHYDSHRRDTETSDNQKKHHNQNFETHKRENSQRASEYRSHVDRSPKKNDSAPSHSEKVGWDESVHSHAKKPENETSSRPEKRSEVEDEIAKVMRNLRDIQDLEPPLNGDIFGSSRNAVHRET